MDVRPDDVGDGKTHQDANPGKISKMAEKSQDDAKVLKQQPGVDMPGMSKESESTIDRGVNECISPDVTTKCFPLSKKAQGKSQKRKKKKWTRAEKRAHRRAQEALDNAKNQANSEPCFNNQTVSSLSSSSKHSGNVPTQRQSERGFVLNRDLFQPTTHHQGHQVTSHQSSFHEDKPPPHRSRSPIPQFHKMEWYKSREREINVKVKMERDGSDQHVRHVTRNAQEDGRSAVKIEKSHSPFSSEGFPRSSPQMTIPRSFKEIEPKAMMTNSQHKMRSSTRDVQDKFVRHDPQENQRLTSYSKKRTAPLFGEDFPRNSPEVGIPHTFQRVEAKARRQNVIENVRSKISGVLDKFVPDRFATHGTDQDDKQTAKKKKRKKKRPPKRRHVPDTHGTNEIYGQQEGHQYNTPSNSTSRKQKKKKGSKNKFKFYN